MILSRDGMRFYLMGLIMLIIAMNIPEVKILIEDRVKVAQPKVLTALKFAYDDISMAVVPLVGKIVGKPKLLINGIVTDVDTSNDFSLSHGQSLTAEQIDIILSEAKSPAIGTGKYWIDVGIEENIDAAYPLGIFYYESGFGTNKAWDGYKDNGTHTYNIGNMICAGYHNCYGRFRDYSAESNPWYAAIKDNTANLAYYRDVNGIKDFDTALVTWAPPSENNTTAYITGAKSMINAWRNTNKVMLRADAQAVSTPITQNTSDGFGLNVKAALDANGGALRNITIKDGERWSFNESISNPDALALAWVSGVYGGGWCDLACRYIQVLKGLGIPFTHGTDIQVNGMVFLQHGGSKLNGCSYDESPYIWSKGAPWDFSNGRQDLIVNNGTGKTIRITVVDNSDGTATIVGKLE